MARWYARFETYADLTEEQKASLADAGVTVVHTNEDHTCEIMFEVSASSYGEAANRATRAYSVGELREAAAMLGEPYRVTVEAADAPPPMPFLSTKGAAAVLGISDARVRYLSEHHPIFPRPVAIPGAAGGFHRTAAIKEFNRTWDRAGARGRPRRQDMAAIAVAAVILSEFQGLDDRDAEKLQFFLAQENGRYLREEAEFLTALEESHRKALRKSLDEDRRERLDQALAVARRLLEGDA